VRGVVAIALLTLALAVPAAAQSLDAASNEALAATLRLLLDPAGRSAAVSGNAQASAIDRQLQGVVGAGNMQDIYALAAAVFNDLAVSTGGDVGKMSQALESGKSNPAGFAGMLSPTTQQRLRDLATKISDRH
jgi:hypothetical protein